MNNHLQRPALSRGMILNPITSLILLALLILLAGLWINSLWIGADINAGLQKALASRKNLVVVNVNGQTVSVAGQIESDEAKERLLTNIQSVKGVGLVEDQLRVATMESATKKVAENKTPEKITSAQSKPAVKTTAKTPAKPVAASVAQQPPKNITKEENASKPKVTGFDTRLPEAESAIDVVKQIRNLRDGAQGSTEEKAKQLPRETIAANTSNGNGNANTTKLDQPATTTSENVAATRKPQVATATRPLDLQTTLRALNSLSIKFPQNSDVLTDEARGSLQRAARAVKRLGDIRLEIGGHTDSWGSEILNQEMSQRRAQSVVNYLSLLGVDADKLAAKGYGETQPKVSNDTLAGRIANRRIEFKAVEKN